jgi:hypothetical protein
MEINGVECSEALIMYLETILWAECCHLPVPEGGLVNGYMDVGEDHLLHGIFEQDCLDDHFDIEDFSVESLIKARADVDQFFKRIQTAGLLGQAREYYDDSHIAYHFWLTRQGHGAGFWDGDYGDIGDQLAHIADLSGDVIYLVGEDGKIHQV